jgi:hypothetical protein
MSDAIQFNSLRQYVELVAGAPRRYSPEQALLAYGRDWNPSVVSPSWLVMGPKRNCFGNALAYAVDRGDVYYVEGYALDRQLGMPMQHAWLVDDRGSVIDPTWDDPEENDYFGIAFKRAFVVKFAGKTAGEPFLHPVIMRTNYGSSEEIQAGVEDSFGAQVRNVVSAQ